MLSNKNKQSIEKLWAATTPIATLTTNEGDSIDVTYLRCLYPTEYLKCIPYTSNQCIEIAVPPGKGGFEQAFEQMIELYSQYIKYHPEERAAAAHDMEGFNPEAQSEFDVVRAADFFSALSRFTAKLSHDNYDFELQWIRNSLNPAYKGENILVARLADGFEAHVALPELTKGNIAQAYTYLETQCSQHASSHRWEMILAQNNLRAQQRQRGCYMDIWNDKTLSSEQRLNMEKAYNMMDCSTMYNFTSADGVEFMGIYYHNGADIGLSAGPTMIAAFHTENGMVYQSVPLESERYREGMDVIESMMKNLAPNTIQQRETADIIRADINNSAACHIADSMDRHRNRTTHFTMMTEQGYIVEANYRKDGAHIGVPGRDVLYYVNPDGKTISMNLSGARMNDIMQDVNTFAASYDKHLAPTRDDVEEYLKPLTIRDNSEIDDIDTGDIGDGDL